MNYNKDAKSLTFRRGSEVSQANPSLRQTFNPRQLRDPSAEDGANLSLAQRWPADRQGVGHFGALEFGQSTQSFPLRVQRCTRAETCLPSCDLFSCRIRHKHIARRLLEAPLDCEGHKRRPPRVGGQPMPWFRV